MKKACIFALGILLPSLSFAQGGGSLNFTLSAPESHTGVNKLPPVNAPIYIGSVGAGFSKIDSTYTVAIYGGAQGTAAADLFGSMGQMTIAQTTGGIDIYQSGKGLPGNGQGFNASAVIAVIPGVAAGLLADVQVRSWKTSMGPTWDAAFAAWEANPNDANYVLGVSSVQTLMLANSSLLTTSQPRLGAAPDSSYAAFSSSPGLVSFALVESPVVPEPGVMALAGLGLVGMLVVRRRK